jgi:hypothetical protein
LLLFARVDPKLEPLVTPHEKIHTIVFKKNKRIRYSKTYRPRDSSCSLCVTPVRESPLCNFDRPGPNSLRLGFLPALKDGVSAQGAI